jgi:NH3-dependent NAD+ synthetase
MIVVMLAQSIPVPPDAMLPTSAVVGIIGGITTLVVAVIGKMKVDQAKAQSNDVTLKKPVPTIETREKPIYAIKDDVEDAMRRIQETHAACRAYQGEQRANIHHRLDDQVKALARMEGTLASVQQTTTTLLDLALNKKPSSRA